MRWAGVLPAITTPFREDGDVDHPALTAHVRWLLDTGCDGIIPLGSLGEGSALSFAEKEAVVRTCVAAAGDKPVVAAIAAASTREAVALARMAEQAGCRGLMVLPPYVHSGDAREALAHVAAVIRSVRIGCMLYNNPIAYGADFKPALVAKLAADHANLAAVKESSGDARRVTGIKALCGDRLAVFVGLDDMVVEGVAMGATGWVAGLVNALPEESVALFHLARKELARAAALYRWFLPLLRMDVVPDFVQRIKLVQQVVGRGSERVRGPRLALEGAERAAALALVEAALAARPVLEKA